MILKEDYICRVWESTAKYCAKKLPPSTDVVAINKGKIVYRRCPNNEQPGWCVF
jgi:hypothetical protein